MALELGRDPLQLAVHLGQLAALQLRDRLGRPGTRYDVLPLGVGEKVSIQDRVAGAAVAREGDAGPRVVAHVAVPHRDDVHRGAQVVGDAVDFAVVRGAARVPAPEDRLDRAPQLGVRALGKRRATLRLDDRLELLYHRLQVLRREVDVARDLAALPELRQYFLERLA